jgi:hypothetical protein
MSVILLADRGFGDTKLFDHLLDIPGFDFIILAIALKNGFYHALA